MNAPQYERTILRRDAGATGLIHRVEAWYNRVSSGVNWLGGLVILPAMTAVMMTEVIARYVFNSPFMWTFELARHLLLLVFLSGLVECTRRDGHIRMDLVYLLLPESLQKVVRVVYYVCALGVLALIIKFAAGEIPYLRAVPVETEYLGMPIWAFYAGLVVIAVMLVILFIMRLAQIAAAVEDEQDKSRK